MRLRHLAVLCVAVLGLTSACDEAGTTAASAIKFHGKPIEIAMLTDLTAPSLGYNSPEAAGAAEAAVDAVNAAGGIKGHKLVISICNGNGDPNTEVACGRTVESSPAVATVADVTLVSPTAPMIPDMAEIMDGPGSTTELEAKNSFPSSGGAYLGVLGVLDMAPREIHATKVSVVALSAPPTSALFGLISKIAPGLGIKIVNEVTLSGTETDFTPDVEQAASNGAQAIAIIATGDITTRFIESMKLNDIKIPPIITTPSPQDLQSLGSAINGTYALNFFPPLNDTKIVGVRDFLADMKKYEPSTLEDQTSMTAWLAVKVFAEVANKLPTVTRASVLNAMTQAKNLNTFGLIPPYSTDKPYTGFGGLIPRAFNQSLWYTKFVGTNQVLLVNHPVGTGSSK